MKFIIVLSMNLIYILTRKCHIIWVKLWMSSILLSRPQDVIIFIVGGTTYEESRSVAIQNTSNSGIRFILGGSVVLNSKRYGLSSCHYIQNYSHQWFSVLTDLHSWRSPGSGSSFKDTTYSFWAFFQWLLGLVLQVSERLGGSSADKSF